MYEAQQTSQTKALLIDPNDGLLIPAIRIFQSRFSKNPDERVDPNDSTLRRLNKLAVPKDILIVEDQTQGTKSPSFNPDFVYEIQGLKILLSDYFPNLDAAQICHEDEGLYRDLDALTDQILTTY